MVRTFSFAGCLAALLIGVGFLWWVNNLPEAEVPMRSKADGIVVLTGSRFRINDALELLAAGHGRRLLISGVYPATKLSEIAHMMPEFERWFACCVDLDHMALDTIGNAVETKRWAREQRSQVAHRRHLELPHAARADRNLASVARCPAGGISGGFGPR